MDVDIANRPPDKNEDDFNKTKLPQDPVSLYIVSIQDSTEYFHGFYREYDRNFSQKRNLATKYFHMDSTKMMSDVRLFVKATAGPLWSLLLIIN